MRSLAKALLAAVLLASLPATALAARGFGIVNTGEVLFETGPLPEPYNDLTDWSEYRAGYKCEVFGLFWIYLHWWSCTPVAFNEVDDTYVDDPKLVAALMRVYDQSDMSVGLWRRTARWAVLALIVFGAGVWVHESITGREP